LAGPGVESTASRAPLPDFELFGFGRLLASCMAGVDFKQPKLASAQTRASAQQ
jgi:hypothetical protein